MLSKKPIQYRQETWQEVQARLSELSDKEVLKLSRQLGNRPRDRVQAEGWLIAQGGLLMVELGLTQKPQLIAGTVFMADDIHEYILYLEAAEALASGAPHIQAHFIGGDLARVFSRQELLQALQTTKEFDQLEV